MLRKVRTRTTTGEWMTMKLTIIKIASLGLVLGSMVLPARADWFNYVVRTSGLGWSDGYHAYDQCPPRHSKHAFALPGYGGGSAAPHAPYYFEQPGHSQQQSDLPEAPLPSAPANGPALRSPESPMTSTLPDPQARYKPRSRYFDALQRETQSPEQLQARRPTNAPPF
jgi:hypothetical protein